jgi:hypothetical protein
MSLRVDYDSDVPFGFQVSLCSILRRAFISEIVRSPVPRLSLRSFRNKFLGAYVVSINDTPIFHPRDVYHVLTSLRSLAHPPLEVPLLLAPERRTSVTGTTNPPPLHLRRVDIQRIMKLCPPNSPLLLVSHLVTTPMTAEERALPKLTCHRLKKLSNWQVWKEAFYKQLDSHHHDGALGTPILIADLVKQLGSRPRLLRFHWTCVVKDDGGTRKARACIDGSKRAAPWLRDDVPTYASCVEQPAMKLFYTLCAIYCFIVLTGDTDNAFQQSPPPKKPCWMAINDAYIDWFQHRFNRILDPDLYAIPVTGAILGHPEAGRSWEDFIVLFIIHKLKFTTTGHERNLYHGIFQGELVLFCRQVDDFAIGCKTVATAKALIAAINEHATTTSNGIGVPTAYGISCCYNGLDVHQTRDYIKLSCETYVRRLLSSHGWETPNASSSDWSDLVPLHPDIATRIASLSGPSKGTAEHRDLATTTGFGYRQLLGELIYAYVIVRVDIGFAVCFLACFSAHPHAEHYQALKNMARYLRSTSDWGIIYWRPCPVPDLPTIPFQLTPIDPELPPFPTYGLDTLVGFVDASQAACQVTRRSVTGYAFCIAGAVVAYKSMLQPVVATSSTEAEFYAAVIAGKLANTFILF